MEPVLEKLQEFKRTAWLPITEDRDGDLTASKFSGKPWLAEDESWPKCGNCGKEMQLFVQLNLDHLPPELGRKFGNGLLQMFYCTNGEQELEVGRDICEIEAQASVPFGKASLVRVFNPSAKNAASNIEIPSPEIIPDYFPAKVITGWTPQDDYPNDKEGEGLGIQLNDAEWDLLGGELLFPLDCDKLVGWPHWVQWVDYPDCPICGKQMRFVFQINSMDHLPHEFADYGCGHITQCKNHLDVVAFGWACY